MVKVQMDAKAEDIHDAPDHQQLLDTIEGDYANRKKKQAEKEMLLRVVNKAMNGFGDKTRRSSLMSKMSRTVVVNQPKLCFKSTLLLPAADMKVLEDWKQGMPKGPHF